MTSYIDPTAPSTTVYGVTDGVADEQQIRDNLPDFGFQTYIEVPTIPKVYPILTSANFVFGFASLTGKVSQGTGTLSIKVDGVAVQGLDNITLDTTMRTFIAVGGQGVSLGQRVTMEGSTGSGAPRDLEFTLACTR